MITPALTKIRFLVGGVLCCRQITGIGKHEASQRRREDGGKRETPRDGSGGYKQSNIERGALMMPYDPEKAAQTIAFFAIREGGEINVLKAIKLVYMADRESTRRRGHPIQDEPRFSLPHGPVNSTTLDHLNGAYRENQPIWQSILEARARNTVGLAHSDISESNLDALSPRELDILADVWAQLGHMDGFELADWTHSPENVPEWEDPSGSRISIPLERIMAAVGLDHPIERAREQESLRAAQNFLASL